MYHKTLYIGRPCMLNMFTSENALNNKDWWEGAFIEDAPSPILIYYSGLLSSVLASASDVPSSLSLCSFRDSS